MRTQTPVMPLMALACFAETALAFAPAAVPGLRARGAQTRPLRHANLKMGLFDAFKNALANEDLGTPPPDGLSQDPWLNGMRKPIYVNFVKEGETVATVEALPGDRLADIAKKAQVALPETEFMMKANEEDVQISATSRVPAPVRRNMIAEDGDGEMMDSGLTAPVWTNLSQRGEVRTVKVERTDYFVYV